jgi:hypothetical protein
VNRFVSVERVEWYDIPGPQPAWAPQSPSRTDPDGVSSDPALSLAIRTPASHVVLRASAGAAQPGGRQVLDEHFVVNADTHREQRWLDCADVLYGSRPRSAADATRWLLAIAAEHDVCRIAAVPLVKGGWATLDTERKDIALLPVTTSRGQWLLPSCLLGWLTSGGTLGELSSAQLRCSTADPPR